MIRGSLAVTLGAVLVAVVLPTPGRAAIGVAFGQSGYRCDVEGKLLSGASYRAAGAVKRPPTTDMKPPDAVTGVQFQIFTDGASCFFRSTGGRITIDLAGPDGFSQHSFTLAPQEWVTSFFLADASFVHRAPITGYSASLNADARGSMAIRPGTSDDTGTANIGVEITPRV